MKRLGLWSLLGLVLVLLLAFLLFHGDSKDCSKYGSPQPPGPGCVGPN
jgi:hypothetical protein